ncbi:DMT family transporter [Ottowia sp.]|uniref:DMT family transporter n=1 Tax=Ottowia sp. TaxID=1898956 RepID=UPI002C07F21C|nr:DMT family transporter [Ottowia sp.]HRN75940.1 DMT family transporter [Ottowia sp.]HRQ04032.1 DMT family transporter [Ottowia sp.]
MTPSGSDARLLAGYWLGVLGVAIFAITLPATRMATGSDADPQLTPAFVTAGRAALAGLLSAAFLLATRSPWPARRHWRSLLIAVAGNVLGFPVLLALAMRSVTATHAAVIMALGPLATAVAVALMMGQRARPAFWVCAVVGSALVMLFAWLRAQDAGGFGLAWADLLLIGAVVAGSIGYVAGAQVSPVLGAERTICWICAVALPVSLPAAWWLWPESTVGIRSSAWAGFVYVGMFSMWAGFFAWYRGLDWGGALRVSQVQLLQPFLSMLFAMPLLGERLDAVAIGFALAVVATVFLSRRLSMPARPRVLLSSDR